MTEKIARDMESLATRDSILRITYADYVADGSGRLSSVSGGGKVYIRPYERHVEFTTATASGTVYAYLPDAGLVAGKLFSVYARSISNSKTVTLYDHSGQITLGAMTTTADHCIAYSNGLFWTLIVDVTT